MPVNSNSLLNQNRWLTYISHENYKKHAMKDADTTKAMSI